MRVGAEGDGRIRAFWPQRSRNQAGVLVTTALTVAVIAFLACAMAGLAVRSPTAAVRASVAAGPASTVAEAYQATLDPDDPAAQDREVRSVLRDVFRSAPVTIGRTAFLPSVAVGGGSALLLIDDPDLRGRATLTAGDWPTAGGGIAVDAALARAAGLQPGTTVQLRPDEDGADDDATTGATVSATVTGIWRPADSAAPAWLGVSAGTGGTDGRLIASPALATRLSPSATAQWVVAPDAVRATAADLPRLRAGFTGAASALTHSDAATSPFSTLGGAGATVADMQQSVGALAAVLPVPLALLAVCSAISLVLLARLLARSRLTETRVLRARGATVAGLVRADAVEALVVAATGALVGAGAAVALLTGVGPASSAAEAVLAAAIPAGVVLALAVGSAAAVTAVTARSADGAPGAVESGRARSAASIGLGVLTLAAAAVTVWRFLSYGAPDAQGRVDAVGTVAPAAVLCAVAVLALVALGPAATAVERLTARGRGLSSVLPARQVSRGVGLVAAPAALVVLAVGAATFAAGYVGTWSGFLHDSSRLVNGSDVRVDLGIAGSARGPEDAPDTARFAALGTVTAAAPALTADATLGQGSATLVAVDARSLPRLSDVGAYMFDATEAAATLTSGATLGGAPLERDARTITAVVTVASPDAATDGDAAAAAPATGAAPTAGLTFWVADDQGTLVPLPATAATPTPNSPRTVSAALPSGGPWTLAAIDVHLDTGATAAPAQVRISGLRAGATLSTAGWAPAPDAFDGGFTLTAAPEGALGFDAPLIPPGRDNAVRLLPGRTAAVPVLITRAVAESDGLEAGTPVDVDSPWATLHGTVAGVIAAVPGTSDQRAVLVDLHALDDHVLRTSPTVPRLGTVWLASPDPQRAAVAAGRAAGADAVVTDASGAFVARFMASAVVGLWAGAAGCALLAVVAVAAAALSALRRRRAEVGVLRAVGVGSREQAAGRRREVGAVVIGSAVVGMLGGVVVLLLAGNTLARMSVVTAPSSLSVQGRLDPAGLLVALAVLACAVAVVLWLYGRAVRAQALDTGYRAETR